VIVSSAGGSSKTSESRQPPDTTGVEGLRTTAFFRLAPDPDAERLDSDAECRKNIGEGLHSHLNYEAGSKPGQAPPTLGACPRFEPARRNGTPSRVADRFPLAIEPEAHAGQARLGLVQLRDVQGDDRMTQGLHQAGRPRARRADQRHAEQGEDVGPPRLL